MQLRPVKQDDNERLAKMIRSVFEEFNAPKVGTVYSDPTTDNLFELFQTEKSILWVAEIDNEIIGCCGIYPTAGLPENCFELVKFYITANSRGKGIGKLLMEKNFSSAKELKYTSIYLESLPDFNKAINIYEKLGFIKLNQPMGSSGHTSCNIWMLMEL